MRTAAIGLLRGLLTLAMAMQVVDNDKTGALVALFFFTVFEVHFRQEQTPDE